MFVYKWILSVCLPKKYKMEKSVEIRFLYLKKVYICSDVHNSVE